MTRNYFAVVLRSNEVEQVAFIARVGTFGISVIDAGQGILEG